MYVYKIEDQVVGFGHAVPGEIEAIFVDPDYQGQGIGRRLLNHGCRVAGIDGASIRLEATPNAEAFYAHAGSQKVDEHLLKRGEVLLKVIGMERPAAP